MTDDEMGDRLIEMREQTARECAEIILDHYWDSLGDIGKAHGRGIVWAIKKKFGIED
jgi:hypothetical protein